MLVTLCALITALTYADAVIVLTQTPAVHTVSPGQEALINCNIEKYDGNYVRWYKQVPGEGPQYVLRFHHSSSSLEFGTGFSSDRFNFRKRILKKTHHLQIMCSSLPPPVLSVFPPSSAELQSNTASLVCLSSQSVPFADVSWLAGGSPVSSGISTSTAVQRPDQTYQISSSLTIQTSDWNMDKVYTCKVSLGSQTSEKTIKKSECPTE
ncbi:neural Wiskott-Aldrich syndrome protein [Sarotherodon galilaeus]